MVAYKAHIVSFPSPQNMKYIAGYLSVKKGKIKKITSERPDDEIIDYSGYLIFPGFVDTHIHLPQIEMRAKWSSDLLSWLENYIFPEEMRFIDEQYTEKKSEKFFNLLGKNGTTTALVYGPPTAESTEIAMKIANDYGLRIFMGQTLMDMNVPEELITLPNKAKESVKSMAKKWDHGRVQYALTLRFAISCSMGLMRETAKIARNNNLIIQTHISEQEKEVEEVSRIHKMSYAEVYDKAGVLYHRTVLAHAIHLSEEELKLISARNAKIAHCPSSNYFLHSGTMLLAKLEGYGLQVGVGSDVAAGPFINMLPVLRNAYYANFMTPEKAFYMLTLGGASVLGIDSITGSLDPGKSADFVVVKPLTNISKSSLKDALAELIFLGDTDNIIATHVGGKEIYHHP